MDESILVVDDDALVRDLLVKFLSRRGYRVAGAKDGYDALRMVSETPPDAVLLDMVMPGHDGFQLASMIKGKVTYVPPEVLAGEPQNRSAFSHRVTPFQLSMKVLPVISMRSK